MVLSLLAFGIYLIRTLHARARALESLRPGFTAAMQPLRYDLEQMTLSLSLRFLIWKVGMLTIPILGVVFDEGAS